MRTILLIVCAFCLAGGAAEYSLGDGKVEMRFDENGAICRIRDLTTGTELLANAAVRTAWEIRAGKEKISSADYPPPEIKRQGQNALFIVWKKTESPAVMNRVEFDPASGRYSFQLTVSNTSKHKLTSIVFPAGLDFAAENDNYLLIASDNKYKSGIKYLKEMKDFGVMHPGFMQLQLAGFRIGDSALLYHTEDAGSEVKSFEFKKDGENVRFSSSHDCFAAPRTQLLLPYKLTMKVIPHGSWNEIAEEYAVWARKQYWSQITTEEKIRKCPPLERIFKHGMIRCALMPAEWSRTTETATLRKNDKEIYEYIPGNPYAHLEPFLAASEKGIDHFEKLYGVQPGYWAPVWAGNFFDTKFPEYFPMPSWMGDFPHFRDWLTQSGRPMLYHINPVIWDRAYAVSHDKKYLSAWENYYPVIAQWSHIKHSYTNLAASTDYEIKNTYSQISDKGRGFSNGVYLDLIGHSFFRDNSPHAAYPGKANSYQLSKLDSFRKIRNVISGPIMTEMANEFYIPYLDIAFGNTGVGDMKLREVHELTEIPLWQLIYGDLLVWQPASSDNGFDRRNIRLSIGGIAAPPRWDITCRNQGTNGKVYIDTAQQEAADKICRERMLSYRISDSVTISNWKSGGFIWNRSNKVISEGEYDISPGKVTVNGFSPNGGILLTDNRNFSSEWVKEIKLNGETVFSESSGKLLVVRGGNRLVIHNPSGAAVTTMLKLAGQLKVNNTVFTGKFIGTQKTAEIDLNKFDIARGEFLVIEL